ncbi:formyltransferase family protein [Campylobacter sp. 19-13652]|uniref:formyltransferase family protein n=1 Tax=Campylobacter sp. 19-13652 TaxID=2840180 RepID=UPI001C85DF2C|nr:formyltransferase family protein [Campylobacter sp. 19-13652]
MFSDIIVVGFSRVANECAKIASEFFAKSALRVSFKEELGASLVLKKDERDSYFNSLRNALIISANNFYIFKPECIQNNLIINYHNALLPRHKGVNAHVWAVYEGDASAGISWHIVDSGIDTGGIISQRALELTRDMSAARLLLAQHTLAISSLKETLERLKEASYDRDKFKPAKGGEYHGLRDLPGGGVLDLNASFDEIRRLLLAYDVGAFRGALPRLRTQYLDKQREVLFYQMGEDVINVSLSDDLNVKIAKNSQKNCREGGGSTGI